MGAVVVVVVVVEGWSCEERGFRGGAAAGEMLWSCKGWGVEVY